MMPETYTPWLTRGAPDKDTPKPPLPSRLFSQDAEHFSLPVAIDCNHLKTIILNQPSGNFYPLLLWNNIQHLSAHLSQLTRSLNELRSALHTQTPLVLYRSVYTNHSHVHCVSYWGFMSPVQLLFSFFAFPIQLRHTEGIIQTENKIRWQNMCKGKSTIHAQCFLKIACSNKDICIQAQKQGLGHLINF